MYYVFVKDNERTHDEDRQELLSYDSRYVNVMYMALT